ncbi:hypothetical protein LZ496_09015 [Sphingomonas sp. NSE70-1]|uniref:Uncharacterized protein n=1 Tax=Sphingomonas caseinilyticus TaxID=2908205 RepID=A0ABT0RV98_9SPHN|nr:hypothetical protein [Sphingomonas caseinilyticus]MCL6698919.1 hypothetical protein [Sphingomonas caseinilyticus]
MSLLFAPALVAADGQWAALQQGGTCEAASKTVGASYKDRPAARASISFDAGGPRHGQFSARLSRVPRPGATVMLHIGDQPFMLMTQNDMAWSRGPKQEQAIIAAMRNSGGMRVEARSPGGGRIVDRYALDGAPLAIDAAAACAAGLANH